MNHDDGGSGHVHASIFPMSAVRGRHPDDLNEGIPDRLDARHPSRSPHAFEWWYFDGRFTDGHTFAGTLQPASPQVYIHVNTPSGRELDIRVDHPRDAYSSSTEGCDVRCGDSTARGAYPAYEIHLAGEGTVVDLRFESLLPGWARGDGSIVIGDYGEPEVFGWCVAQPRARVTGTISYDGQAFTVEGEGYHDHNWGDFDFQTYISRWHWGRITRPDLTLVFADIATTKRCGEVHVPLLLVARGDRLVFETYEAEWTFGAYELDASGLQAYPRRVGFSFSERDVSGRLSFEPKAVLETDDMLKDAKVPGWAEGVIGRVAAQPVYFRLDSSYDGEIDFGGDVVALSGETIIEYMVFTLRRGQVPDETTYRHFLHPPVLERLHAER